MYLCTTGKPSNESNKGAVGDVLVYNIIQANPLTGLIVVEKCSWRCTCVQANPLTGLIAGPASRNCSTTITHQLSKLVPLGKYLTATHQH